MSLHKSWFSAIAFRIECENVRVECAPCILFSFSTSGAADAFRRRTESTRISIYSEKRKKKKGWRETPDRRFSILSAPFFSHLPDAPQLFVLFSDRARYFVPTRESQGAHARAAWFTTAIGCSSITQMHSHAHLHVLCLIWILTHSVSHGKRVKLS